MLKTRVANSSDKFLSKPVSDKPKPKPKPIKQLVVKILGACPPPRILTTSCLIGFGFGFGLGLGLSLTGFDKNLSLELVINDAYFEDESLRTWIVVNTDLLDAVCSNDTCQPDS